MFIDAEMFFQQNLKNYLRYLGYKVVDLNCPKCGKPHMDIDHWAFDAHRTHLCLHCGETFRDNDVCPQRTISNPVITVPVPGSIWLNNINSKKYVIETFCLDADNDSLSAHNGYFYDIVYRLQVDPRRKYRRTFQSWFVLNRNGKPRFQIVSAPSNQITLNINNHDAI